MDYDQMLDAETWAYIRKSNAFYPEDAVDLDPKAQRKFYDALAAEFEAKRPDSVTSEDANVESVPIRIYTAGDPTRTVVFFHGGGFVVGSLDSHDSICAETCAQTGYRVVAVDYRLSPEFRHPAAFDDCWMVTKWALDTFEGGVVLMGDSAGGCLAASVAHHARGRLDGILGQVLIYPALGETGESGSFAEHANAPLLTRDDMKYYETVRLDGPAPENDPTYLPLQDGDYANLPPTILITADCDPVRDDARDYLARIQGAGGLAHWVNEPGLVHGYLRARHSVARARDSFERISIAVEALGQGIWPYD